MSLSHGVKLYIKQSSGINTENFTIFKLEKNPGQTLQLSFSVFYLNGIYYISLNNEHIIDYKKFISIEKLSYDSQLNILKVTNSHYGDLYIKNCDLDIFNKSLLELNKYMKDKTNFLYNISYYFLHS